MQCIIFICFVPIYNGKTKALNVILMFIKVHLENRIRFVTNTSSCSFFLVFSFVFSFFFRPGVKVYSNFQSTSGVNQNWLLASSGPQAIGWPPLM